ncbi:MAG TPA: YXWGXW repeat-containing protein [Steroidobacteraceae bacterium]|nr:YXWGXW repeat-containing protein [Steroidobacteraceae bacterium]
MHEQWRRWLAALFLSILPMAAMAQFGTSISVNVPPPALPVYEQPPIPGDGYLWVPGYWYWSDEDQDYYWVPGTWVEAPEAGLLWTPGYWGAENGVFLWHPGYWGPHVGFYGGVNYGYGYGGRGFDGGYWRDGRLFYNRAAVNVGRTHISNVYQSNTTVNNVTGNRVSYNGGPGGIQARPTPVEESYAREHHVESTSAQARQVQAARSNPGLQAKANHGHPPITASVRPGEFAGPGGAPSHAGPQPRPASSPQPAAPAPHPAAPPFHAAPPPAAPPPPRAEPPQEPRP